MKHLSTYNESIRDKMTGKSVEELKNIIERIKERIPEESGTDQLNTNDKSVYRITISYDVNTDVIGYFTKKAFKEYLDERNLTRILMEEEIEGVWEFDFEPIIINY